MNKDLDNIKTSVKFFEELTNSLMTSALKISTLIGGGLIIVYCFRIGYFPTDLSISDGFILIAITIFFGLLYSFTLISVKSYADLILWLLLKLFSKLLSYYPSLKIKEEKTGLVDVLRYSSNHYKLNFDNGFCLFFSLVWLMILFFSQLLDLYGLIIILVTLVFGLLIYKRMMLKFNTTIIKQGHGKSDEKFFKQKDHIQTIIFIFVLVFPIFSGAISFGFVSSSMKALNLANDNVIVHISKPYDNYLTEYGITNSASSFGKEFVRVENTDVLLQGLGDNVVLNIPRTLDENPERVKLLLPKDKIHIIDE